MMREEGVNYVLGNEAYGGTEFSSRENGETTKVKANKLSY